MTTTTPRGIRNKNLLNIRANQIHWRGQLGDDGLFVKFVNYEDGIRAALKILQSYHNRGIITIGSIIRTWAPPSENATSKYVSQVCTQANVFADTVLNLDDETQCANVLYAMACVECGRQNLKNHGVTMREFYAGYFLFKNY